MAHEFELERTALYALGTLSEKETEEAEAHLVSCSICMDEYAELRDTASFVALSAEISEEEHAFRLKRLQKKLNIVLDRQPRLPQVVVHGYDGWYRAVAAAAIVLAVGTSVFMASLGKRLVATQAALQHSQAQQRTVAASAAGAQQRLAVLFAPDAHRYEVGSGVVVTHAGSVYLAMSSLPPLAAGHVFQAWTLAPAAVKVAASIVFTTDAQGRAFIRIPEPVAAVKAVAVSIEPAGGSTAPTTKPLFIQVLS